MTNGILEFSGDTIDDILKNGNGILILPNRENVIIRKDDLLNLYGIDEISEISEIRKLSMLTEKGVDKALSIVIQIVNCANELGKKVTDKLSQCLLENNLDSIGNNAKDLFIIRDLNKQIFNFKKEFLDKFYEFIKTLEIINELMSDIQKKDI